MSHFSGGHCMSISIPVMELYRSRDAETILFLPKLLFFPGDNPSKLFVGQEWKNPSMIVIDHSRSPNSAFNGTEGQGQAHSTK